MQIMASGQCWAQAAVRVATIVALVLNRSSRVMPENNPIRGVHKHRMNFQTCTTLCVFVVMGNSNMSETGSLFQVNPSCRENGPV